MTKTNITLDPEFYLTLLYFINNQIDNLKKIIEFYDQGSPVLKSTYSPLFRTTWDTIHTALHRFDPALTTQKLQELANWATACLWKIDELDNMLLPPSSDDTPEGFHKWAEWFDPRASFFDDNLIEDLVKFLPLSGLEATRYRRVRRVLWKKTRAEESNETQAHGQADVMMSMSDLDETSEPLSDESLSSAKSNVSAWLVALPYSAGSTSLDGRESESVHTRGGGFTAAQSPAPTDDLLSGIDSSIGQVVEDHSTRPAIQEQERAGHDGAALDVDVDVGIDQARVPDIDASSPGDLDVLAPAEISPSPSDSGDNSCNLLADTGSGGDGATTHNPSLTDNAFPKNDDDIEHGEGTRGAGPNFEQQGQADEKISDIDSGMGVGEADQGPHGEVVLLNGSKALVEGLLLPTESVGTSVSLSADTAGSNSTVAHGPAGANSLARGTDSTSQLGE